MQFNRIDDCLQSRLTYHMGKSLKIRIYLINKAYNQSINYFTK